MKRKGRLLISRNNNVELVLTVQEFRYWRSGNLSFFDYEHKHRLFKCVLKTKRSQPTRKVSLKKLLAILCRTLQKYRVQQPTICHEVPQIYANDTLHLIRLHLALEYCNEAILGRKNDISYHLYIFCYCKRNFKR